ncbi:sigma-54-dependent Fis family transcriptional regulator [Methylibium sp. Pch-M]|uniref:sigma-54 dependent transcriptional regulator n=1 Tax=Methylibium sp. Pch-M TaxID=2082386 RepID=UPI001010F0AF|nr:sigma-54 dependent transcriptional regulator [Methylibium sp. Pch-M]QAZ39044.1 sigma-54-dependent Fis family transcriptional regulator [Methylibium sp. Pch-M]
MSAGPEFCVFLVGTEVLAERALQRDLARQYVVLHAPRAADVARLMLKRLPDVVVCEQQLEDGRGVDLLQQMRIEHPHAVRVLALQSARREEMAKAINEAAVYQVVTTPFEPEQLSLILARALESRELARIHRYLSRELKFADAVIRRENDHMTLALQQTYRFDKLVFASEKMAAVCNTARKAATTDLPVLLEGETGTGKELLAKAIHLFSPRQHQLFMAQNCGAIAEDLLLSELFGHTRGAFSGAISDRLGLFVAADKGTVFLDEISDISPAVQVALLRFLQDGEVKPIGSDRVKQTNVRIIAASNRPVRQLVDEGRFRRDLYYRLKGFEISIPPLRERPDDIPVLTEFLITKYCEVFGRRTPGVASLAQQKLRAYPFPGNVRELENEIRRTVATLEDGEFITVQHLSPEIARARPRTHHGGGAPVTLDGQTLKERVEQLEVALVRAALERHHWNHTRASEELGLSRVGLANKLKRYSIRRSIEPGLA